MEEYAKIVIDHIKKTGLSLSLSQVGFWANIGILLNQVIGIKKTPQKNFAVVDGAMNDVIRLASTTLSDILTVKESQGEEELYDIVGPIWKPAIILARTVSLKLKEGFLLYTCLWCLSSSNYNSRPRAPSFG